MRSLYVDDSGSWNVQATMQLSSKVKTRQSDGGFNTRKWTSNSSELVEEIQKSSTFSTSDVPNGNESPRKQATRNKGTAVESNQHVLGQCWDTHSDQLKIDFTKILAGVKLSDVTKRDVLSTTAKFYDPLGLISPIVLMFKLFFQQLCQPELGWDEILNQDITRTWESMINSFKGAKEHSLNRCYCKDLCPEITRFLQESKESWPTQPIKELEDDLDCTQELKSNCLKPTITLVHVESQPKHNLKQLIDPSRYSRIVTLLRVTAYVLRFVRNL